MIDVAKIEVRSIEELISALHPVQSSAINSNRPEAAIAELRLVKSNITAVLSFTSHSLVQELASDSELRHVIDEVRRECLLINGMISRILFRQRWLFSTNKIEDARDVLAHYEDMASAACRMCLIFAPELGNNLLSAF
jgi:hypothetical protein